MTREHTAGVWSAELPAPIASANHKDRKMNNEKKRILLVDDEPSITRLLKLNLEQTGDYEVATENVSKAALATAEEFRPDLILLDVMMPDLDGGGPGGCVPGQSNHEGRADRVPDRHSHPGGSARAPRPGRRSALPGQARQPA